MKGTLNVKKQTIKDSDIIPILASTLAQVTSGFSKLYLSIDDDSLVIREKATSQKPMHRLPFSKLENFGVNSATDVMYFVRNASNIDICQRDLVDED